MPHDIIISECSRKFLQFIIIKIYLYICSSTADLHWHFKAKNNYYYTNISHQAVLNLLGYEKKHELLLGSAFNEEKFILFYENINDCYGLFQIYLHKLILSCFLGNFHQSKYYVIWVEEYFEGSATEFFNFPVYCFYGSLALLALCPKASVAERDQMLEQLSTYGEKMKLWAQHAADDYSHKYYLIERGRKTKNTGGKTRKLLRLTSQRSLSLRQINIFKKQL